MIYEEAIIVLKEIKKDMIKKGYIRANALDLAIKALQKQVPMKPKKLHRYKCCPSCDCFISQGWKFCDECGQRIDWSEEE